MASRAVLVAALAVCGAARAADWPQFRGPNRDGKSAETGLLKNWPAEGPKLLWTAKGCGAGYGSPAIAGGLICVTGDIGGKGCLVVFDMEGKPKQTIPFSKDNAKDQNGPGARSTPTLEGGMIYVGAPFGELACFDAKTLQRKWEVNIQSQFRGKVPGWEYSDSPLIDGQNVICTPGGPDATIAALDKNNNGKTVWTSKGLSDGAAYSSCIKITVDNAPQIVTLTAKGLVGVSANTGQFLWRYDRPSNTTANCPTAVAEGGRVFAASGYGNGGGAVDLKAAGNGIAAKEAWQTKDMNCHHGGYVLVDGFLYGNNGGGWACLDWQTGQTKYKESGVGKGSVIYADGMLYCMSENGGKVGLVPATPTGHKIVSQFSIPKGGQGPTWAHPSISDGKLYVRHGDMLYCYDIKGEAKAGKDAKAEK